VLANSIDKAVLPLAVGPSNTMIGRTDESSGFAGTVFSGESSVTR
jgi:hypothetical protein